MPDEDSPVDAAAVDAAPVENAPVEAPVVVEAPVSVEAADATPAEPVSRLKEWGAAIALMIAFAFICAAFVSMLRN